SAEDWDADKERPKNIYLKRHKELNSKLDRLRISMAEYLNEVNQKKAVLTKKAIQGRINRCLREQGTDYPADSLLFATYNYIQSRTHLITVATYKRYQVFLHLLERFAGHQKKRHRIADVNA